MNERKIGPGGKARGTLTNAESKVSQLPRRTFLQSFVAAGIVNAAPSLHLGVPSRAANTSKTIDIHAHYYPVEYLDLLDRFGGSETGSAISRNCFADKSAGDLEFRFRVMDEAGIDMQVLSVPPQFPYLENEQHGLEAARLANDLCADLARQHPERFEAFAIFPHDRLAEAAIEYKGLTARGTETPWIESGNFCGTQGQSLPLVGFAVRQKAVPGGAPLDCEYTGYFQSGAIAGPTRNGAPCRSVTEQDPLEDMQLRITPRPASESPPETA